MIRHAIAAVIAGFAVTAYLDGFIQYVMPRQTITIIIQNPKGIK